MAEARHETLTGLQTLIDALPDSMVVLDLECRVVLANRAAREACGIDIASAGPKCYEVFHRRTSPCCDTDILCPIKEVFETKAPYSTEHVHFDAEGRETNVEITAAPICDASGKVVQIVESCRDVTERKLSHRFLEIGNRHSEMKPLLEEITAELRSFTGCAVVGIRVLDKSGGIFCSSRKCPSPEFRKPVESFSADSSRCVCMEVLGGEATSEPVVLSEYGATYIDSQIEFQPNWQEEQDDEMQDACRLCGSEVIAQVPIRIGDRTLGYICLGDRQRHMVLEGRMSSLERLAVDLGAAIQRVQSVEALRAAHDQLEARVEERTRELSESNRALREEIAERGRLEREILKVGSEEQRRIGQELHDGIGQELTGLSYLAGSLSTKLKSQGIAEADVAAEIARGIPLTLAQIRKIVRGLIPLQLSADDLSSALEALTSNTQQQTNISCQFVAKGHAGLGTADTAVQVFRIAQEAVANAVKHAQASEIVVELRAENGRVRLEVRDDGNGIRFDAKDASGYGLSTMKHRARALGGEFGVREHSGGGTLVFCELSRDSNGCPQTEDAGP